MTASIEKAPRFAGMGGHHSHKGGTVEWLTPPALVVELQRAAALIGVAWYDIDPCAAVGQPWLTARRMLTRFDNGLTSPWGDGRAYVNPPYNVVRRWLARLAEHGRGTALIFARTETEAFFRHVWEQASALLFMKGRIDFHLGERWQHPKTGRWYEIGDLAPGNAGAPTVLCAYGIDDADVLAACHIAGQVVPLRFPRSVLGALVPQEDAATWADVVAEFFAGFEGPVELADLYQLARAHPKSADNRHPEAKVRQMLQRGPYRRVDRGLWEEVR